MLGINAFLNEISNPFLDVFFLCVSFLMTDIPLVIVLSYIYLCLDKEKAFRAGFILLLSMQFNFFVKDIFKIERPYAKDNRIINKDVKYGYGYSFPSNHSQMSSTILFSINRYYNIGKWLLFGIGIVILIAFSRIYLGVHSIFDVSFGIVFGYILVKIFGKTVDYVKTLNKYYILFLFQILGIINVIVFKDKDALKILLLNIGFLLGYLMDLRYIGYKAPLKLKDKLFSYIIGIMGVAVLYIFIDNTAKYFFVGLWLTFATPYIYTFLKERKRK